MPIGPADFLTRFFYRIKDDEPYWVPGTLPDQSTIDAACAAAKDVIGFPAHQAYFTTLAEVIDACTAEELKSHGNGISARNAAKHPLVVALTKTESTERAGVAAASAQGLAWMEDCRKWVWDATLRNQIAKRVMTGIVVSVGRIKKGYSPEQLAALVRLGASLNDDDVFVLRVRGAIAEILGGNFSKLPRDQETVALLVTFLHRIAKQPNAAPVFRAMDVLASLTSEEYARKLKEAAAKWR